MDEAERALLTRILVDITPYGEGNRVEPVQGGQSGGRVYRLYPPAGESLILKVLRRSEVAPHLLADYPGIELSELRLYRDLLPDLGLPGPRILRSGRADAETVYLLMEDLSLHHRLFPASHVWTAEELRAVLATYALMHARSLALFQQRGVPTWLHADPRQQYDPEAVLACFAEFSRNHWTAAQVAPILGSAHLESLLREVSRALHGEPAVLLYNDFYPCNVALPTGGGPAKLFDWQLVGTGPMHLDLVNIGFLEGSEPFRQVDGPALLEEYLDRLAMEGQHRPQTRRFLKQYDYAALLGWAVFMPRMVSAMHRCNQEGRHFSLWMAATFETCLQAWTRRLSG